MLLEEMKARRLEAGLSFHRVGVALGITGEGYRQKERGNNRVTGAELAILARLYGMAIQEAFPSYVPTEGEVLLSQQIDAAA